MEEALTRQEYAAIATRLPPKQALSELTDRQNLCEKLNHEVAEWLMERRKIEVAYATSLAKLAKRPLKNISESDMGLFAPAWRQLCIQADETAHNHYIFTQRVEKDVEIPLRSFLSDGREARDFAAQKSNMATLATMAASAQKESDKLASKGAKANAAKVDAAASKLQNANQQWDAQAPFILENFQLLDEARLNQLREVLTQYQTHEMQILTDSRRAIEKAMNALLEIDTAQEIKNWAQSVAAGRPNIERRTRQLSVNPSIGSLGSPDSPAPPSSHGDRDQLSEYSNAQDQSREPRMKRIGTMLGRRRQSIHGGFTRATSPTKMPTPFNNRTSSRDGGRPSPRPSMSNLQDTPRLASLAETPNVLSPQSNGTYGSPGFSRDPRSPPRSSVNGGSVRSGSADMIDGRPSSSANVRSPSSAGLRSPENSMSMRSPENLRDSEGFSSPRPMNDPISQAQQEAAAESDQPQFKLDIRNEPIQEQDAEAQAALSSVTNTLRSSVALAPTRKLGTVRGRRDVRNTVYNPAALEMSIAEQQPISPPSPNLAPQSPEQSRAKALAALSSPESTMSDSTSIRSGTSLAHNVAVKHTDSPFPGLNASIIETVSATFQGGEARSAKIIGEVALNFNNEHGTSPVSPMTGTETIRVNNASNLEAIGTNRTFAHQVSNEKNDEYTIDVSALSPRSSVAFSYRVDVSEQNLSSQCPVLIKPVWRPQADKLGLVIEYCVNPAYGNSPLPLNNFVLVAIYNGAKATSCQTKPSGTHLKERSLVYWRLGDVTLSTEWQKVICRFGGTPGNLPTAGHIETRWEIHDVVPSGITLSKLEGGDRKKAIRDGSGGSEADPFSDDGTGSGAATEKWMEINLSKKFVTGKYEAT